MRIMKKLVAAKMVEKPYSVNALYVLHGAHFATEQMREAPKYRLEKIVFIGSITFIHNYHYFFLLYLVRRYYFMLTHLLPLHIIPMVDLSIYSYSLTYPSLSLPSPISHTWNIPQRRSFFLQNRCWRILYLDEGQGSERV